MPKIHTLFEDQHLLAIHKPENIPFHSDDESIGIVRLVRDQHGSESLFPIHRLDRMTSGLMVFAKTTEANEALSRLLESKQCEKYYLAIASAKPRKKQGAVKGDMVKSRRGSFKLLRESSQPAVTRFFARSFSADGTRLWAFLLKPETGKTHQLRVALKSLGSPILGDKRYSGDPSSRGHLHAYCMRFKLFGLSYDLKDALPMSEESLFGFMRGAFSEIDSPQNLAWGKQAYRLTDL